MALFKSKNPVLSEDTFTRFAHSSDTQVMTIQGTVNKMGILLLFVITSAAISWYAMSNGMIHGLAIPIIAALGALGISIVLAFKPDLSPTLAPVYAILKGAVVGLVSLMYENMFGGIVAQALGLTICIFVALLIVYKLKIIKVTENFKLMIAAATMGIALFYLLAFGLSFFGVSMPLIHSNGTFGIIFSLVVVVIAALNLVVDFDFIEEGANRRAPKYMEWYGAFGLLVTLIWLYFEILRLLAKLNSRD